MLYLTILGRSGYRLVATATEWACGDVGIIKLDDNLMIPLTSCATLFGILALIGGL